MIKQAEWYACGPVNIELISSEKPDPYMKELGLVEPISAQGKRIKLNVSFEAYIPPGAQFPDNSEILESILKVLNK